MTVQGTLIAATSAAELLDQSISATIMINKRFLIYVKPYMDVSYGSATDWSRFCWIQIGSGQWRTA